LWRIARTHIEKIDNFPDHHFHNTVATIPRFPAVALALLRPIRTGISLMSADRFCLGPSRRPPARWTVADRRRILVG
jgi:hypothetical protein